MLSEKKFVALLSLLGLILVYHAIVFSVPFVIAKGRSVGQGEMFIYTFAIAICTAMTIGKIMKQKFEESQQPKDAFIGSVIYLSAGFTPISWFSFAKSLGTTLSINWTF